MRAQIIALTLAAVAAPLAAQAQALNRNVENELRMRQAQEQLRQQQQQAPNQQIEQRLNDLDQRVRTQQNLNAVVGPGQTNVQPNYKPVDLTAPQYTGGIDLSAQSALMSKELAAENERLKAYNRP